jgi:outer membrane protein assembly factor BamB
MRQRLGIVFLIAVVIALVLTACGRKYRLRTDNLGDERPWAASRGSAAQTGNCDPSAFEGRLHLIWSHGIAGKPAGPLSIHHGTLVYPDTRKKIRFYDLQTGRYLGRLKAKGVGQTGVAIADSLAFWGVAPRRDGLFAYNLNTSKRQWEMKVKDAYPGPIIWDNRLVVSSGEGTLFALELNRGEPVWKFQADQRLSAAASFGHGRIFQPADRGWLYAVSADSGRELYRVRLSGPIINPVAVADKVYVAVMTGQVYALEPDDGAVVWMTDIGHPIWTSPTVANGRIFVGHSGGEVVALEASTGLVLWRYDAGAVIRCSALAAGDYLVTGTMTGLLTVLRTEDGVLVDSTTLKGPIKAAPVSDGRRLLIATEAGKIYCFGESDEQADLAHKRIDPQLQSQ